MGLAWKGSDNKLAGLYLKEKNLAMARIWLILASTDAYILTIIIKANFPLNGHREITFSLIEDIKKSREHSIRKSI